jgi:hypothetical protein
VRDQFNVDIPASVEANELFTTGIANDWPGGTNWFRGPEMNGMTQQALLEDHIQGQDVSVASPRPGCNGNSTPVQHWEQEWWIGSLTSGSGRFVQINTLQKRLDYAEHTNPR